MNRANWPEVSLEADAGSPRLYDAGAVEDWVDILVARRSSLLLCGDDAALDRQAQLLLQGLRKADKVETALIFDMDRSLLLERFNRLLSEMTVDQARAAPPAVVRVWVFQVQTDSELDQARLLLRLSQDLPGAGVVVLLLASVRLARELAPDGSGRRLQVRVIGDPWARTEPPEAVVASRQEPTMAAAAAAPPPPPAPARRGMPLRTTVLAGFVLLLASAGVVLFLRPFDGRRAQAPVAPPAPPVVSAGPAAASAVMPIAAPSSAASAVAPAAAVPASAPVSERAAAPAAPGTVLPPAAGKTLPPPVEAVSAPREQVARTASWIDAQPESSWLVQHSVSWRASDMLDLRARQPALADARIVALFRSDGRVYYALVSGPFDSAIDARNFEKSLPNLATPSYVRSIARVKKELEDPSSAGGPGSPPAPR